MWLSQEHWQWATSQKYFFAHQEEAKSIYDIYILIPPDTTATAWVRITSLTLKAVD